MSQFFEKYFTLDEAAALIPFVIQTFDNAHVELDELKDEVILYKRMHQVQEEENGMVKTIRSAALLDILNQKWHAYEECFYRWVSVLSEAGIQVRDFKKGLIDFPYQAKNGSQYLLCWHLGEEGLFYFHDLNEGFNGRQPISLLPD